MRACAMALLLSAAPAIPAARADEPPAEDTRPLSPAQTLLFETQHLQNVTRAGTLGYAYVRDGAAGFADTVAVQIRQVNPDGSKNLAFDYLTGTHHVVFPELDHFRGNPLLMLTLERDVAEMKDQVGLSTSYFRNKLRQAFVDRATVADGTFILNGAAVPAKVVTVRPFTDDPRLERMSQLQAKTYTFVLSDQVPGTIAEIRIDMPRDERMGAPAFEQRTTFQGVQP